MGFGKLRQQAIEDQLQRAALGLPPRRRPRRLGPRLSSSEPARKHVCAFCQRCGALRLPGSNGKLPPHRCSEAS